MKSFFKEFLRDDPPVAGDAAQIVLGAFGKHPGWNDHMDDIGLETESLIAAKHLLYVQGIGGQLNSGAWEKLDGSARLPAVHVEFIWARGAQILAGRMWPSSDGKGRKLYPMTVCAHGFGVSAEAIIERILPLFETVEARCRATKSGADVHAIVAEARDGCAAAISGGQPADAGRLGFKLPDEFVKGPLAAILHEVRSAMASYLDTRFRERAEPLAAQVRLPVLASSTQEELIFWSRFFAAIIDGEAPLLLAQPLGHAWLDVIAGEPGADEIFCFRAAPPALPMLGEGAGNAGETEQHAALNLVQAIIDPGSAAARARLSEERSWLQKIFG